MTKHTLTFSIDRSLDTDTDAATGECQTGFSDPRLAAFLGPELAAEIRLVDGPSGRHIVLHEAKT